MGGGRTLVDVLPIWDLSLYSSFDFDWAIDNMVVRIFLEEYLYKTCRAMIVQKPLELDINLLDILIKTPTTYGLERSGSLVDLGTASSEEAQLRLRQGLISFQKTKGMFITYLICKNNVTLNQFFDESVCPYILVANALVCSL
jgi:hypothetical protein